MQNFLLLETLQQPAQHLRAQRAVGLRKQGIEEALRVFRLVQIIVDAAFVILGQKIDLLLGFVDLRSKLFEFVFLMLEAQFHVMERRFQIGIAGGAENLVEKSAAVEAFAEILALFLEVADFVAHPLRLLEQRAMRLVGFGIRRIFADGQAGFPQEFVKERVHDLEAVGVAHVVAEQNVVLEKKPVIFAAIEKDQPVLQQVVKWREVLAKERAASLADDVFLRIRDHLRDLLADNANHAATRSLQFGELCLNDMGLLAALEMLAALANPFLSFENEIGKLIADFEGEKFQQSEAKKQVDLDVLVKFCLGHRALQQIGEQLAESRVIRALDGAQLL